MAQMDHINIASNSLVKLRKSGGVMAIGDGENVKPRNPLGFLLLKILQPFVEFLIISNLYRNKQNIYHKIG